MGDFFSYKIIILKLGQFVVDGRWGDLLQYVGNDPINHRSTGYQVEDQGLRKAVFENWFADLAKR